MKYTVKCRGCGKEIPPAIVGDALCTRCRYHGDRKAPAQEPEVNKEETLARIEQLKRDKPAGWLKEVKSLCKSLADAEGLPSSHGVGGDPNKPDHQGNVSASSEEAPHVPYAGGPKHNGVPIFNPKFELPPDPVFAEAEPEPQDHRPLGAEVFLKWARMLINEDGRDLRKDLITLDYVCSPDGSLEDLGTRLGCSRQVAHKRVTKIRQKLAKIEDL
jgi:hypothetical protein